MKKNYTDITFVLDRSGSMASVREDTIGGFNSFLESQKKEPGECTFTMVQFDTAYEFVHQGVKLASAGNLTKETFVPRGGTALLDAIGRAINETGKRLASMDDGERPEKVIFVIQTDGEENSSKEFTREKVFEMINHQRDAYKWEFIFLGANQDAIHAGAGLGISAGKSMTYAHNTRGSAAAYQSMSKIVSNVRKGTGPQDFEESDREEQTKAGVVSSVPQQKKIRTTKFGK